MKKVAVIFVTLMVMLPLSACNGGRSVQSTIPSATSEQTESTTAEQTESATSEGISVSIPEPSVEFSAWEQPEEDKLMSYLSEKVDDFSTNIFVLDDALKEALSNSNYANVRDSDIVQAWENRFLEWGYGATNFDFSSYSGDVDSISELLKKCGDCALQFPEAFLSAYYGTYEMAGKDFDSLSDLLEEQFGKLIDIVYVKDISLGDTLSGNEYVTFSLDDIYYVDDILYTTNQKGMVSVLPDSKSALVVKFTVTNIYQKDLSFNNTGLGSASDYIKISAKLDNKYEYKSDIYVEDAYGYSAVYNSFSGITPLESRPVYAIIEIPSTAKNLPAVISIGFEGTTYKYQV